MEQLFGLPAHPLLVHFPIVAIPTLALLALIMIVMPSFRDRFGKAIMALGFVTAAATIFAAQSGQALLDTYSNGDFVDEHKALGETLRLFVLGLTVSIVGLVMVDRRSASTGRDPVSLVMSVIVAALAILSLIWAIRTGHEGARLRWG